MTMEKKELILEREWTLAELMSRFKETFGATLRIYDDHKRVSQEDSRRIDEIGTVVCDNICVRDTDSVAEVEKRIGEIFGLQAKIAVSHDWGCAPANMSLGEVCKIRKHEYHPDIEKLKKR